MSYLAPDRCWKLPHRLRSTRGPRSRYFSGSHVCHTWGGSTTWSSTLMILGSAMSPRLPNGPEPRPSPGRPGARQDPGRDASVAPGREAWGRWIRNPALLHADDAEPGHDGAERFSGP